MNFNDIANGSTDSMSHDFPLQSGAILPAQFHPARRGSTQTEPIRRLMFAILIDGLRCFQANLTARGVARRRMFWEARQWIFAERGDGPFSFDTVCGVLEVDPGQLRRWLSDWREKTLSGAQPGRIRRTRIGSSGPVQNRTSRDRVASRVG